MVRAPRLAFFLGAAFTFLTAAAGAVEVRGRVTADGGPLAGASIQAVALETPLDEALREARRAPASKPLATATSGADGSFVLALPPATPPARLLVAASGRVSVRLRSIVDGQAPAEVGTIAMERAQALSGKIVDPNNGPVVGATVTLWPAGAASSSTVTTGADGAFRFDGASATGNRLRVEASVFATVELANQAAGALHGPVVLSLGRPIRGTVVLPDGRTPAAGVAVRFEATGAATRRAETRADGVFVLEGVPLRAGTLAADAGARGHGSSPLAAGGDAAPRILLAPLGSLHGRVVESPSAKPLPAVRVTASAGDEIFFARSGADGRYEIGGLANHQYVVSVDEPRYVPWRRRGIVVGAGQSAAQDIALTPAATLSGKVVDENGKPIEGATGRLLRANERGGGLAELLRPNNAPPPAGGRGRRGGAALAGVAGAAGVAGGAGGPQAEDDAAAIRTGKDGTFKATHLAPGDNQRLVMRHDSYETVTVGGISLPAGGARTGLSVVLPKGLALSGVVHDGEGHPVAGADVDLVSMPQQRGGFGGFGGFGGGGGAEIERRPRLETGPDGKFEFLGLSAGDWALGVTKAGFAREVLNPVKVAAVTPPVEVVLHSGATISGVVRDGGGTGVPGYFVIALRPGGMGRGGALPFASEPTGPDGAFHVDGLDANASYDLQALAAGGRGARRTGVAAPAEGIEMTLTTPGRIQGSVSDGEGRPVTEFEVSYQPDGGGGQGAGGRGGGRAFGPGGGGREPLSVHAEDGGFTLEDVAAGRWSVQATAKGFQRGRVAGVVVDEGASVDGVAIRLEKGSSLSGRVLEQGTDKPVVDASVQARLSGGRPGTAPDLVETDADGHYELSGLAPGSYTVTAHHPDWSDTTASTDLKDAPATLDLHMNTGGAISGTVQGVGRIVVGATVTMGGGVGGRGGLVGGGGQTAVSDGGGRFRFDRLAAGRYLLSATYQGQTTPPVEAVLATANAAQDVTLVLGQGTLITGTVTGLPDAQLSGVRITANGQDGFSATSRTGPGGTFSLTGAPSGTVSLRADSGDLTTGLRSASTQVTIADGQTQIAAAIDFPPGFRLSGKVTRQGSPVSGAMVGATSPAATGNLAARTDDNGGYELDGLVQGTYSLSVSVPNGSTVRRSVDVSEDMTYDVEVPTTRVAGNVVEAGTQKPLSDAAVQLQGVRRGPGLSSTDSSGHFAIEDLDPNTYHMTVTKSAYQTDTRDVTASDDSDLRIELKPGDGIQLVVHDGIYGMPLSNVMVRVADATGLSVFAGGVALDSTGLGVIPSLKPGTYLVRVSSGGYATTTLPAVVVPAPPLQVSLTPGGTLIVQVGPTTLALNTTGQLIAAGLPATAQGVQRVRLSSPSQEVDHVAPGHYTLAVEGGVSRDFDVREGAVSTVALP